MFWRKGLWRKRTDKKPEKSTAKRISPRARFLAGICLVLLAGGASAGLLDFLKKPKIELITGLIDLSLNNLVLNVQLLGLVELEVDANQLLAVLSLDGGIEADLVLTFEQVENLSEQSAGLSAQQLDPLDPLLLQRLPAGVQPQGTFPMLVHIEPPTGGGLGFENAVDVELHTHNLEYQSGTRLRLFAASAGGNFRDITRYVGEGSYRCRGSRGKFSEFLIAADQRDTQTVIGTKFDYLQSDLDNFRGLMSVSAYWTLLVKFATARSAWYFGDEALAVQTLESALAFIDAKSGSEIPNDWHSSQQGGNAAGELSAAIHTLIFSLQLP